jgi:hypothetical protein
MHNQVLRPTLHDSDLVKNSVQSCSTKYWHETYPPPMFFTYMRNTPGHERNFWFGWILSQIIFTAIIPREHLHSVNDYWSSEVEAHNVHVGHFNLVQSMEMFSAYSYICRLYTFLVTPKIMCQKWKVWSVRSLVSMPSALSCFHYTRQQY